MAVRRKQTSKTQPSIEEVFDDGSRLDRALRAACQEARMKHQSAGVPLVVSRDGAIAEIDVTTTHKRPELTPGEPADRMRTLRSGRSVPKSKRRAVP